MLRERVNRDREAPSEDKSNKSESIDSQFIGARDSNTRDSNTRDSNTRDQEQQRKNYRNLASENTDSGEGKSQKNSVGKAESASLKKYGPLQDFLEDPSIEEIWINSPQRIFVARNGKSELTNLVMTTDEIQALMDRILLWSGRRIDLSQPFVDARLPDGSRLHIAIPEITPDHWAINIRKHLLRGKSIHDLVELGVLNEEIAGYLAEAVASKANLLVSGSTQAGKTTLLNALVSSIPVSERVITIEEVFELKPNLPDCVAMQTRGANLDGHGEITIRRLIKEALRMRPSRLVIGEIREAESLDLLIALNSGIPGMATLHANSAREAIRKLQTLPMLAGENITQDFLTPTVARAVDLVVHVGMDLSGTRRILEILAVGDRTEGGHVDCEEIYLWNGATYTKGVGQRKVRGKTVADEGAR